MNAATIFEKSARQFPGRVALRCRGEEMTYRELDEKAGALARFLRENGLGDGDRVAIFLPNCPEYMVCVLGAWKAGGVALPVNFMFPDEALRYVLEDSESSWLAVRSEDIERMRGLLPKGSGLEERLIVVGRESAGGHPFGEATRGRGFPTAPRLDSEDAMLMYTSGTTGRPKGVRQTHRNNSAATEMVVDAWGITQEDHWLLVMPMFHVGGLQCSTFPLLSCGGTMALLPGWSAEEWLETAAKLKPTMSALIATMVVDLVNHTRGQKLNFSHVRLCVMGGSPTPEPVVRRFQEQLGLTLSEIYGQTENTGLSVTYRDGEERLPGSTGRPMEEVVRARVVQPQTGEDLLPGDERAGELYLRGDIITPGYWRLPEKTAEKFEGGWLRTGDIVRRDEKGHLFFADRIDDMIVSGGENVYPQEVEGVLAEHEGIAEVAVIGTPHVRWIEQVTAIIVPGEEGIKAEEVDEFCKNHSSLAGYQRPRRIELVEALPRTGSGKIDKATLKATYGSEE